MSTSCFQLKAHQPMTLLCVFQINGVEVRSREDAIQLFSENRANISLLIARAVYQVCMQALAK